MEISVLDEQLKSGVISPEGYKQLLDAEVYGTATPMQWLGKRLVIVQSAINSGVSISFNTGSETGKLETAESFNDWC